MNLRRLAAAVALSCLALATYAAANLQPSTTSITLKRGSTLVPLAPAPKTLAECETAKVATARKDAETKTSGQWVYTCDHAIRTVVTFTAIPTAAPTCTALKPAQDSQVQQCPPGTVGTWAQTRDYVAAPYPTCWSAGNWTPSTAPAGICAVPPTLGAATLQWTPPTRNTDGTTLTDLAGYRIVYGTSSSAMNHLIDVPNAGIRTYVVDQLAPATYYFAVQAYTSAGVQSALSNIASKTILP